MISEKKVVSLYKSDKTTNHSLLLHKIVVEKFLIKVMILKKLLYYYLVESSNHIVYYIIKVGFKSHGWIRWLHEIAAIYSKL